MRLPMVRGSRPRVPHDTKRGGAITDAMPHPRTRRLVGALALLVAASLATLAHAWTRTDDVAARRAAVRAVGFADLALSSSARWIRHPSQVELAAPFQDGPASFDTDPAGAIVGPPVEAR